MEATIDNIRQEASPNDAYQAFKFISTSPLAKSTARPDSFPEFPMNYRSNAFFKPARLASELSICKVQFDLHEIKLENALSDLIHINQLVIGRDWEVLGEKLSQFRESYGVSLLLLKKCCSILALDFDCKSLNEALSEICELWSVPRPTTLSVMIKDSLNREYGYFNTRRQFLGFAKDGYINQRQKHIVQDYFDNSNYVDSPIESRIQAYLTYSSIDALFSFLPTKNCLFYLSQSTFLQS